ncbi:MAG TPA: biopolymer transporter ExbD [Gemmataceae bacterium]|nr:biopolymer transporter ExbD [Gemmataceae bacterium]
MTHNRLDINLTPLLDLVLQLIMFFMLTVNFVRADQTHAGVDLPVVQSAMPLLNTGENLVFITVGKNGERIANGVIMHTFEDLQRHLQARKDEIRAQSRGKPLDVVVVVRGDKDASCGHIWDTLDDCSRAGCHSWQLRVIKQSG